MRLRRAIVLALVCAGAAPPVSPPPSPWPPARFVRWQPAWGTRTIEAAGVSATVALKHCGVDRPAGEACSAGDPFPVVRIGGLTMTGAPGVAAWIGIGRLTRSARRPALILISDDGGSGGCVQIDLAVPDGAAYRTTRLSVDPDDHGTICEVDPETLQWPRDSTGHGRAEFLFMNRLYGGEQVSHAGEWRAPRVVAFDGYRAVDVSNDRSLDPLFRRDMKGARAACGRRSEPEAPCTAFAVDAARFGTLPDALHFIDARIRRGCRVAVADGCPYGDSLPAGFRAGLVARLARPGGG